MKGRFFRLPIERFAAPKPGSAVSMRVIATYTTEAMIGFDAWLRSLGLIGDDAEAMVQLYLLDFRQKLEEHDGVHPEAIRDDSVSPVVYRVPFILDLEIVYTVVEVRRWFWRSHKLVTIERFRRVR